MEKSDDQEAEYPQNPVGDRSRTLGQHEIVERGMAGVRPVEADQMADAGDLALNLMGVGAVGRVRRGDRKAARRCHA